MTGLRRLPRVLLAALLVAGLLGVMQVSGGARPAQALSNCSVSDLSFDAEEQAFLTLINNYRAQNGLGQLTVSVNLNRAASWMAADLATKNYFSHTDSLGRSPSARSVDCGGSASVGENIAAGTVKDTAQEAFDMWKASPGHNQNMLYSAYRQIGIARYYNAASTYSWYWVTDFGTTDDGTNLLGGSGGSGSGSTPTPTPSPSPTASPSPAPIQNVKAQLTSPTGSSLYTTSVTFRWSAGSGALEYGLDVGTSRGGTDIYSASEGSALSQSVSGLPHGRRLIYVRLWTRFASGWQYTDYVYRGPR